MKLDDLKARLRDWADCKEPDGYEAYLFTQALTAITDLEALREFVVHKGNCSRWHLSGPECTCGLSATLAKLEKARG